MKIEQSHSENLLRLNLECQMKENMKRIETTKERLLKIKVKLYFLKLKKLCFKF